MTTIDGNEPLVPGVNGDRTGMLVPQGESQAPEPEGGAADPGEEPTLEQRFSDLQAMLEKSESDRKAAEGRLRAATRDTADTSAMQKQIQDLQQLVVAGQQFSVSQDTDAYNETVDGINQDSATRQIDTDWQTSLMNAVGQMDSILGFGPSRSIDEVNEMLRAPEYGEFLTQWGAAIESKNPAGVKDALITLSGAALNKARSNVVSAEQSLDNAEIYDTHSGGSTSATNETDESFLARFGDPSAAMTKADAERAQELYRKQGIRI